MNMGDCLWTRLQELAGSMGIPIVGCLHPGEMVEEAARLRQWLAEGNGAGMTWLDRPAPSREQPGSLLPGCRSIVVFGFPYPRRPGGGSWRISRYALGEDYHRVINRLLAGLLAKLRQLEPALGGRVAVDTSPLMEKALAVRAGLGWQGKHTCLIHPRYGSYLFLGELLLDRLLPAVSAPSPGSCGDCRRCLEACPTGALREPGVLDARRCLAYLTIEHRDVIPSEFRGRMGGNWFGCDLCQEACPYNQHLSDLAVRPELQPDPRLQSLSPGTLSELSEKAFRARFGFSSLPRATLAGLMRNAVALLPETAPELHGSMPAIIVDRFELAARQWREFNLGDMAAGVSPGKWD
jgi:epoxyqueuosine reductase